MHVVHVSLPLGVELQINRWNEAGEGDYINTKITMSKQPMQDGHCGNFNGDPKYDIEPIKQDEASKESINEAIDDDEEAPIKDSKVKDSHQ